MLRIYFEVKGLDEAIQAFRSGSATVRAGMEIGVEEGSDIVRGEMKIAPPIGTPPGGSGLFYARTGDYQSSIISSRPQWTGSFLGSDTAPDLGSAPYAPLLEDGTGVRGPSRHPIVATNKRFMKIPLVGGGFIFRKQVAGIHAWKSVEKALAASTPLVVEALDRAITAKIHDQFK